ncbi:MAG: response regulator transcription factor [Chloroflexi bacterium]|nr:response regulator transcription factor [Chloroflexota bacterium]MBP8056919.1 response regulator transcription factor [Chloroflexota bacterium]
MSKPLALIIEDDPKLGDIFTYALEAADFVTELIADGDLARARLAEIVPSVVVLDLHLPHVSGEDLLQQIRADERLTRTRVMFATADARLANYLRQQSDLVLLKPISPAQLRDLAKRLRPIAEM